jgi:hypothetical protein
MEDNKITNVLEFECNNGVCTKKTNTAWYD